MKRFPIASIAAALAATALAFVASPASAAITIPEATSQNWAGYVAGASNGTSFSRVSGSWMQPSANASSGDGYSAFWVGLGGDGQSQSLEQIGTQADVTNGQPIYYAWYELVPSTPVKLSLAIHPGDHISASVVVSGSNVTVSLSDQTTGSSFARPLQMSNPDTSSADWIAEAPSTVYGDGSLQTLPLADFGKVGFTGATATEGGHTGPVSDSAWSAQAVQLGGTTAGAQPGSLSGDGSSFSVSWQGSGADPSSTGSGAGYGYDPGASYGPPGYGYDPGAGYGYGYGSYGYGGYASPGYAYGY